MWNICHTGLCKTILLICVVVSDQVCVVFIERIRLDVATFATWILTPEDASIPAATIPGIKNIDLAMASDLVVGISLTTDMISISMEE